MSSSISSFEQPRLRVVADRYVVAFLSTVALTLVLLAGFNIHVDSYDVFATLGGDTVPIRGAGTRLSKAYAIRARQPDCVILGTSRAAIGYRSDHPAWSSSCARPYNASLPKAHIYEVRRYLEHAMAQGEVKQVFLALDFEMFRNNDRLLEDYSEDRLSISVSGEPQRLPVNELLGLALSVNSTRKGAEVITTPDHVAWFDDNGNWRPESMQQIMQQQGRGTSGASRTMTRQLMNLLNRPGAYDPGDNGSLPALTELDTILELCRSRGTQLIVVVNPVHAYYHEVLDQLSLKGRFEHWKQDVASWLQRRLPAQQYWHFDLGNRYTLQPLPADDDYITELEAFWDPSHFRRKLGDDVMQLALQGTDAGALERLQQPQEAYTHAVGWPPADEASRERIRSWLKSKGREAGPF